MNTKEAINIVSLLADGISPETGEVFPEGSPYQNPETIRALFVAIKGMERLDRYEARSRKLPENAGKAWAQEEDTDLVLAFDAGTSIPDLASKHQRTVGSIQINQTGKNNLRVTKPASSARTYFQNHKIRMPPIL